jgi:hypothetical protein
MSDSCKFGLNDVSEMYERLSDVYRMAAFDRKITSNEIILIPVIGEHAQIGAAMLLAILCYPEDIKEQTDFIEMVTTGLLKGSAKPNSSLRTELKKHPAFAKMISTRNDKITKKISKGLTRLHSRLRAANVLLQKLISSEDPRFQKPLANFIKIVSKRNTSAYSSFYSNHKDIEDQEEQIIGSFRQRIIETSKPVVHIAMAIDVLLNANKKSNISIYHLIKTANDWLPTVVEQAEIFRVLFGDIFPRRDTQYNAERAQNINIPLSKSISVLPLEVQFDLSTGWEESLKLRVKNNF